VTIAEESTAFPLITAPPDAGGLGFCFKWDMGFMHDTIDYMSLNPFFRSNNHNKLTFSMMYAFSENFILAYSHDEVVHGKASMINKMYGTYEEKFAALRTLYGYQYAHPGKKHTFMGSEFGQFIEWNYRQQLDWLLLDYPLHKAMQDYSRALNSIYVSFPALYRIDNSWDGFRWLNVNDNMRSSIAFLRTSDTEGKGKYLVCVCNFTTVSYEGFVIGLPQKGTLTEILNSDDTAFGGTGTETEKTIESRKESFLDMDYSAALTLPANSCIYYEYEVTADESDTED
jgi:1,4-alpha-glucan branching enzyme